MDVINLFFWVIFPYIAISVFFIGNGYRYLADPISWRSKSSEILEKKLLRPASLLFHYGIILAFIGHIIGIVIPKYVTEDLGISESAYHLLALVGGTIAGVMVVVGLLLFIYRRLTNDRLKTITTPSDWVTLILLISITTLGLINTLFIDYDYRETVAPWFRGLWTFTPDYTLMADVPLLLKIHVALAFILVAVFPFTRLVHILSIPLSYIFRRPVIYRERCPSSK